MLRVAFIQQYIINKLRAEHFAQPMGSAMHDLCMKYCIDLHQEQIPEGINLGYFEFMGLGTVVDSLCAVKELVFEEKKLTMDQLIKACDANFEGYEDIKALVKTCHCYGNNDPYADSIGRDLDRKMCIRDSSQTALKFSRIFSLVCPVHSLCFSGSMFLMSKRIKFRNLAPSSMTF